MKPDHDTVYRGVSRIAWSYLFAFLDLNLGSVDVLPDWAAFALIYGALNLLAEEEQELLLLKPFCVLLGLWEGCAWVMNIFGLTLGIYPLSLVIGAISLYFYFQLLTDLARLAGRYAGENLARRIRRLRTAQAIFNTLMTIYLYLAGYGAGVTLPGSALTVSLWVLLITGVILMARSMFALFDLRRSLPREDEAEEETE